MADKEHSDEREVRREISPLATPEERGKFLWEREQELKRVIRGPSTQDEWLRAEQELDVLRYGHRSDEEEWMFGR